MKIYIISDHGGFNLKKYLADSLNRDGLDINDLGPFEYNIADDYPDYVPLLAETINNGFGVVICKNGVGVSMLANKYRGVRAALVNTPEQAKTARTDDNANIIALPADFIDEQTALQCVKTFVETSFSNDERHIRRLKKVENIENNNFK